MFNAPFSFVMQCYPLANEMYLKTFRMIQCTDHKYHLMSSFLEPKPEYLFSSLSPLHVSLVSPCEPCGPGNRDGAGVLYCAVYPGTRQSCRSHVMILSNNKLSTTKSFTFNFYRYHRNIHSVRIVTVTVLFQVRVQIVRHDLISSVTYLFRVFTCIFQTSVHFLGLMLHATPVCYYVSPSCLFLSCSLSCLSLSCLSCLSLIFLACFSHVSCIIFQVS